LALHIFLILESKGGFALLLHFVQAVRVGMNAEKSGDVGRIMIVAITDGRANVSLAKSNGDEEANAPDAPRPTQKILKVYKQFLASPRVIEM
jgi:magnesium chelatase subunit D